MKQILYFIHGMWNTPAVWAGLRTRFEAAGYATYTGCLPYHDRAPDLAPDPELGEISVADYIDFLIADIGRLPQKPIIIGHSMGSFLAQAVAERLQPPGLVLLSPAATATTGTLAINPLRTVWGIIRHWGWWKSPTLLSDSGARFGVFNGVPNSVADAEIAALVWDSGRVLYELSLPGIAKSAATTVNYARLSMPVLIVTGETDHITPVSTARATARSVCGTVDYHELSGVGHWLFHDPVVVLVGDLLETWLLAQAQ